MADFNIQPHHEVVSHSISPTDGLHKVLSRAASNDLTETDRVPYPAIHQVDGNPLIVTSVMGELFPGDTLVVKVRGILEIPQGSGWPQQFSDQTRQLRTPRTLGAVDRIIRNFIAIATGGRAAAPSSVAYRDYFIMQILSGDGWQDDLARQYIALLIDHPTPSQLGSNVVARIIEENETLNQKAESEHVLINRQGAILIAPGGGYRSPNQKRFRKTAELATIALFAREFLNDRTGFASRMPATAAFVGGRIERLVSVPDLLFESSFANKHTWDRFSESFSLDLHLADWNRRAAPSIEQFGSDSLSQHAPANWWEFENLEEALRATIR